MRKVYRIVPAKEELVDYSGVLHHNILLLLGVRSNDDGTKKIIDSLCFASNSLVLPIRD